MVDEILKFQPRLEDDYYAILGCDPSANVDQIQAEYRAKAKNLHPDKNPGHEAEFALMQRAKEILTDKETRKFYDQWRGSGIAIPFEIWLSKKEFFHMSMHWAPEQKSQPAIGNETGNDEKDPKIFQDSDWKSEKSTILNKFRNYQI